MKMFRSAILIVFCQFILLSAGAQLPTINVTTNTTPSEGYTFLANFWMGTAGKYYLLVLDKEGRVVYAKSFPTNLNGSLLDFKPQPNNKYSFFSGRQGAYFVMDKFFNIIDTVAAKNGYSTNEHELHMTADNHYFLIADETRTMDLSTVVSGGNTDCQVTGNIIQQIDTNDNLLFEWKVLDYLPITDYQADLTAPAIDFAHTNAIFPDSDSSVLMCNAELNEVTRININNDSIIWRMGLHANGNQFTFINDTLGFIFQHYPTRLPNGNILIFDNGISRYSRVVEYAIDDVNKTATQVFQYRHTPNNIYANAMGSTNRLPNGNTFICWGSGTPNMTEVDTGGNKVFEARFFNGTYRALKYDIPSPIARLVSGPEVVCEGQTVTYTARYFSNATYSWSVTNGTIESGQGTNILTVRWPTDGQGKVMLTKTNTLNFKDYFNIYVEVIPGPSANMGVENVCKGAIFTDNTSSSISRFWNFGDGETSALSYINHRYNSPGTYQVKLKVSNSFGCTDSSIQNVIIPDTTVADFNIDSVVCVNEEVNLINNTTDASIYAWDFGNSTISSLQNPSAIQYSNAGTYTVKLVASGSGCIDSISKTIIVNPNPQAQFGLIEICNGARLSDSSIEAVSHFWDFGDGNISNSASLDHIYSSPGTYQVKLKVNNIYGCVDSSMQTIIIPDEPQAHFGFSEICQGVSLKDSSLNSTNQLWDFGNGDTSSKLSIDHVYGSPGTYQVKLKVFNDQGCVDSSIQMVVIPKKPTADFNMNSAICVNEELSVINNSADADSYSWDFGNSMTSNLENPLAFSYNMDGLFDILLVASGSGCIDSLTKTVVVNPNPEAHFGYSELCNGARFIDSSSNVVNQFWDFGDGNTSTINDISHIYGSAGNYQVKLKVINSFGCSDSNIQSIIIPEAPIADFSIDSVVCANEELTIVNSSTDADAFFWYSGGLKISELKNPLAVSFPMAATYDIKLVATGSSCKDSLIKTVVVNPNPIVRISYNEICLGARFIDSTYDSEYRVWHFGDGSTSTMEEIEHLYNSPGTYPVRLVVNNSFGCADSTSEEVSVQESPIADFSIDSSVCELANISIINQSTDASIYHWDFGDGQTSDKMIPEDFNFKTSGAHHVKLIASTSVCSDSLIQTVVVNPNPVAKLVTTMLSDSTIQFSDSSSISTGNIVSWEWDFGDGQTSNDQHPEHTYLSPGNYTVELCATSDEGCVACATNSVLIKSSGISRPDMDQSISVFPNPNKGVFTIKSSEKFDLIIISNIYGQEVLVVEPKSETEFIDLGTHAKGVYFVKLRLEDQERVVKIIKE